MSDTSYITRKGYEKLHKELEDFKKKRPIAAAFTQLSKSYFGAGAVVSVVLFFVFLVFL